MRIPAVVIALMVILPMAAVSKPLIVVTDGDTIWVGKEKIRIIGYDAPETYQARCEVERKAGQKATGYLRWLVANNKLTIRREPKKDRYKRTLARVYIKGRDLADIMIGEGLAVRYDCPRGRCPRRISWCDRVSPLSKKKRASVPCLSD